MKSVGLIFLKIVLVVALGLAVIHFWPVVTVPLALGAALVLGCGLLMLVGLVAAGAVGMGVIAALFAIALAILGALSPVWIPLLLVFGCIWLIRKLCAHKGPGATVA